MTFGQLEPPFFTQQLCASIPPPEQLLRSPCGLEVTCQYETTRIISPPMNTFPTSTRVTASGKHGCPLSDTVTKSFRPLSQVQWKGKGEAADVFQRKVECVGFIGDSTHRLS